jgi:hypothetical protein
VEENDTFRGEVQASRLCRTVVFSITGVSARLGDDESLMGVQTNGSMDCTCVSSEVKQDRRCFSCVKRGRILVTTLTFAGPSPSPIEDEEDANEGDKYAG